MNDLGKSFTKGYESLSAWADLLDRINVFPVADGDTGTNLRVSLAPFRDEGSAPEARPELLARCATGNSGNIAASFFREFCLAESFSDLEQKSSLGRDKAWLAIADPCTGTMLSVFDCLATTLAGQPEVKSLYPLLCRELQQAVSNTSQQLPDLKKAGVVDSGALAMYIFFEGFFRDLTLQNIPSLSIIELFAGKLQIRSSYQPENSDDYCIDAVIQTEEEGDAVKTRLARLGESVVVVEDEAVLKLHIHSPDPEQLQQQLQSLGKVVQWSDQKIQPQRDLQHLGHNKKTCSHVMTDAAGSLTRALAGDHAITLLDSYIVYGDESRPESLCSPQHIYSLMRKGGKVTTAQASTYERHQYYQSICSRFGRALYLCVGSAFTGNYDTAVAWKKDNDPDGLLTVIDTGAASGRLALIALLTARQASLVSTSEELVRFARKMVEQCMEYVFIDELKYLVAGGRVSKAKGFFGDLLRMKPIVSPTATGVVKAGVARSKKGQLAFALEKLSEQFDGAGAPVVLLQYSDNEDWVASTVEPQIRALLPLATIRRTPLSLTSGVHMGPGSWSMAYVEINRDTVNEICDSVHF